MCLSTCFVALQVNCRTCHFRFAVTAWAEAEVEVEVEAEAREKDEDTRSRYEQGEILAWALAREGEGCGRRGG